MKTRGNIFKVIGLVLLTAGCEKSTPSPSLSAPPPKSAIPLPTPPEYAIVTTNEQLAMDFTGAPATMVLNMYREFMGAELDIQLPREALWSQIRLQSKPGMARAETARLIETALREQAGIVVTRIDDKHLKATFDNTVKKNQ